MTVTRIRYGGHPVSVDTTRKVSTQVGANVYTVNVRNLNPVNDQEEPMSEKAIWECKIGETDRELLPNGADAPLRQAVAEAYKNLIGEENEFLFSGWGAKLSESEREIVEADRNGIEEPQVEVLRLRAALELIAAPQRPDGTYNRDREACGDLARITLAKRGT